MAELIMEALLLVFGINDFKGLLLAADNGRFGRITARTPDVKLYN